MPKAALGSESDALVEQSWIQALARNTRGKQHGMRLEALVDLGFQGGCYRVPNRWLELRRWQLVNDMMSPYGQRLPRVVTP